MKTRCDRIPLALAALAGILALALPVGAQSATFEDEEHQLARVTAADVYVRSGPADSYYPFGRLERGDLVRVVGEKYNWARIRTVGPAFDDLFGYIRLPRADAGRFRLLADGSFRTLREHDGPVFDVVFSPDGRLLVTGCADHTTRVWNPRSGEIIRRYKGDTALALSFSPDGRTLAEGTVAGLLRFWDDESGSQIGTLTASDAEIRSAVFLPDGKTLVVGSKERVTLWDVSMGEPGFDLPVGRVVVHPAPGRPASVVWTT